MTSGLRQTSDARRAKVIASGQTRLAKITGTLIAEENSLKCIVK